MSVEYEKLRLNADLKGLHYGKELVETIMGYILDKESLCYEEYCKKKGISESTFRQYIDDLDNFPILWGIFKECEKLHSSEISRSSYDVIPAIKEKAHSLQRQMDILDFREVTQLDIIDVSRRINGDDRFDKVLMDSVSNIIKQSIPFSYNNSKNASVFLNIDYISLDELKKIENFCKINRLPFNISVINILFDAFKTGRYAPDQVINAQVPIKVDAERREKLAAICQQTTYLDDINLSINNMQERLKQISASEDVSFGSR